MAKQSMVGPRSNRMEGRSALPGNKVAKTDALNAIYTAWVHKDDPYKELIGTVNALISNQGYRLWDNTRYLSMYANTDFLTPYYMAPGGTTGAAMPRMSYNLLKVYGDTLASKLVQSNSRISLITSGGQWSTYQRARKIERALEGEFYRMKLYREAAKVALDAINIGDGWLKICVNDAGDGLTCERVFPNEVFVDEVEAAFGQPKFLYQVRWVKKDSAMQIWNDPDKAEILRYASEQTPPRFAWTLYSPGMIQIIEGWCLPIGNRPGRHVICCNNGTLLDEEWKEKHFPFINFKAGDKPFGWYGQGFIEQVGPTQLELNKIINVMMQSAHLGMAPFWVVQSGAELDIKHLSNQVGHIVEVNGPEPKWVTNEPFNRAAPMYVQQLQQMIQTFYGINEMESSGQLPLNRLDSRRALIEWQNLADSRHTILLERWQDFYMECGERTLMLAKRIAKEKGGYPVLAKRGQKAWKLDWQELDLEGEEYMIRLAPANILPTTVAGKKNTIEDWMRLGLLSKEQAQRALTGPPDADSILAEFTAAEDDIDRMIEEFTEKEQYRRPTPRQDLPRAIKRMTDAALEAANNGAPQSTINLFDRYIREATELLKQMTMAAPPGGMSNGSNNPSAGGTIGPDIAPGTTPGAGGGPPGGVPGPGPGGPPAG